MTHPGSGLRHKCRLVNDLTDISLCERIKQFNCAQKNYRFTSSRNNARTRLVLVGPFPSLRKSGFPRSITYVSNDENHPQKKSTLLSLWTSDPCCTTAVRVTQLGQRNHLDFHVSVRFLLHQPKIIKVFIIALSNAWLALSLSSPATRSVVSNLSGCSRNASMWRPAISGD